MPEAPVCLPQALVCPAEATPICSSTCHPRPQLLALPVGDAANPEGQQAPLGTARWVLGDLVSHTAWGDWPEPDHRPGVTLSGCSQPPGAGDGSCAQSGGKGRARTVAGWTAGRPGASPQDPPRRPRGPSSAGPHRGRSGHALPARWPDVPGRGAHLTEPRRLPFIFSWLRPGRCAPVGHRGPGQRPPLGASRGISAPGPRCPWLP